MLISWREEEGLTTLFDEQLAIILQVQHNQWCVVCVVLCCVVLCCVVLCCIVCVVCVWCLV
jgi:hypothetical protein